MNCSILVKNILIQVVPNTFSIFLMIDAFDTLTKILPNKETKRYYRRVVETMSKAIEANIYYYLDFQTMKLI